MTAPSFIARIKRSAKHAFTGIALALAASTVSAQSLHVIDDAYVDSGVADVALDTQNIESKRLLVANLEGDLGNIGSGERIAYFKHEVQSLPNNLNSEGVVKASIRLWVSEVVREGNVLVHLITENWDERTITFNNRPAISPFFTTVAITEADENHWITIDITNQFKDWANLPQSNFGIALTAAQEAGGEGAVIVFSSKEGVYATNQADTTTLAQAVVMRTSGHKHKDDGKRCGKKHDKKPCKEAKYCEKDKKKACYKYRKYAKKAKYYYIKAMKYQKYCERKGKDKYCKKYEEAKEKYERYLEKAHKYKEKCEANCDDLCNDDDDGCPGDDCNGGCPGDDCNGGCPGDDCNGGCPGDDCPGGGGNGNLVGPSGHPSEIEAVITSQEFDLVGRRALGTKSVDTQVVNETSAAMSSLLTAELNLSQSAQVLYMASLSVRWQERGVHTLRCEATVVPETGSAISLPVLEKTLTKDMRAELISLNGSSLGEALRGNVKVEVYCDILDRDGKAIAHELAGSINAWSVPSL